MRRRAGDVNESPALLCSPIRGGDIFLFVLFGEKNKLHYVADMQTTLTQQRGALSGIISDQIVMAPGCFTYVER